MWNNTKSSNQFSYGKMHIYLKDFNFAEKYKFQSNSFDAH